MIKTVSALKARQNLGQLMNEVALRGDDYIVERSGKPLVAIVAIEKYQQLQDGQNTARKALDGIWEKMKGEKPEVIDKAIQEAIKAARRA